MDTQDMTTKGATTMINRYRRIQREIQEEQGEGDEGGFTLIELLIVIVVLGILAAVTVFGLSNVTGKSLTSACRADAKSVAVAQEAYRAQNAGGSPGAFAPDTKTLVDAGYLRSDPGLATSPNASHYLVKTDNTSPVGNPPANIGGRAMVTAGAKTVDFEVDPTICDNLP